MKNYKFIPTIGERFGQWTVISNEIKKEEK
jgi:hypothetical protein